MFSYPGDAFHSRFPEASRGLDGLREEYDKLFRSDEIWLYGAEYTAKNEFQRVECLADIMGFYKAFGVEPRCDRPDALECELEFMHYLIFKNIRAVENPVKQGGEDRSAVCLEAQSKFFNRHLYAPANRISELVISKTQSNFYAGGAEKLLEFMEAEKKSLVNAE